MNAIALADVGDARHVAPNCGKAVLSTILGAIALCFSGRACGAQTKVAVPDGSLESADYDTETDVLQLHFVEGKRVEIKLDPNAQTWQNYLLIKADKTAAPDLVRFCSSACYAAYGQKNDGVILYTAGTTLTGINTTRDTSFARLHPKSEGVSLLDWRFVSAYRFAREKNSIVPGRPLCDQSNPADMLAGVSGESCYVVCSGLAKMVVSLVGEQARTVPLVGRTDKLDGGYRFLWSEWHTTTELSGDDSTYVADPSYGFVYVKGSASGQRLNTAELIDALHRGQASRLVFGTIHDGQIYDVPGEQLLAANPSIASLYYTPDKNLGGAKRSKGLKQRVLTLLGLD